MKKIIFILTLSTHLQLLATGPDYFDDDICIKGQDQIVSKTIKEFNLFSLRRIVQNNMQVSSSKLKDALLVNYMKGEDRYASAQLLLEVRKRNFYHSSFCLDTPQYLCRLYFSSKKGKRFHWIYESRRIGERNVPPEKIVSSKEKCLSYFDEFI